MHSIYEALAMLTPYDIDIAKKRIGPYTDGGYVFADCISPMQTVISYGVSTEYQFDQAMAEAGHMVYMFDHTIEGIGAHHKNMRFIREGVGGITQPEKQLYTVHDHLNRFEISGNRLLLKMDVEGWEFDAIWAMPDETLGRFEQIGLEVHDLSLLEDPVYRLIFTRMFEKLNAQFTLFHVHANNCDGPNTVQMIDGFPMWNVLELSYIKTSLVKRSRSRTVYPTVHDYPNLARQEKRMWFFPFMPTDIPLEAFSDCEQRVKAQAAIFEEILSRQSA